LSRGGRSSRERKLFVEGEAVSLERPFVERPFVERGHLLREEAVC